MSNDWWYQITCDQIRSDQIYIRMDWLLWYKLPYLTAFLGGERGVVGTVLCDAMRCCVCTGVDLLDSTDWVTHSRKKEYQVRVLGYFTSFRCSLLYCRVLCCVVLCCCVVLLCVTWRDSSLTALSSFYSGFIPISNARAWSKEQIIIKWTKERERRTQPASTTKPIVTDRSWTDYVHARTYKYYCTVTGTEKSWIYEWMPTVVKSLQYSMKTENSVPVFLLSVWHHYKYRGTGRYWLGLL